MSTEILEGTVEHITYQNQNNGYTVCDISSDNALICAVGCMPSLACGEQVRLTGSWVNNPSYGEQFSVTMFERLMPKEAGAILLYLSSGIIKGVGEATARKIVDEFGSDTLKVIESDPVKLSKIKGITKDKAYAIQASYIEKRTVQNTIMFLQNYGVSVEMAMRAHTTLGNNAVNEIKQNPYILCDKVHGIGFESADKIAMAMLGETTAPDRIKSGIRHVLSTVAIAMGHTYLPETQLTEYTAGLLNVDEELVINQYTALLLEKELYAFESYDEGKCFQLSMYYNAEKQISKKLAALKKEPLEEELASLDSHIRNSEKKSGIILSEEQKYAVKRAIYGGVTVITGGPGTGKTTIIRTIIHCLEAKGLSYCLAAPTGRAAKRMSDACLCEAKTLHRLLEIEYSKGDVPYFSHDENNPLDTDFLIVDEVSMVDTLLMNSLTKALAPGTGLILLGDADQLPSVGAGSVLKDIIQSDAVETMHLTYIYRQAAESMIVTNAHRINNGEMPAYNKSDNDFFLVVRQSAQAITDTITDLCKNRLPRKYSFNPLTDIQVVTPVKKSLIGTFALNSSLQEALNPPDKNKSELRMADIIFREGDKVMQTENDYNLEWTKGSETGSGIFNGDMGIIESINKFHKAVKIRFDDGREANYTYDQMTHITLAYAVTVHKSQGSEFECVVMPVYKCAPQLMTRNLFYTAVTRAKTLVVLVGMMEACEEMVRNNSEKKRYSALCDKLA